MGIWRHDQEGHDQTKPHNSVCPAFNDGQVGIKVKVLIYNKN
jgi:hypothetical protein